MSAQINATIALRPDRLNFPLATLNARVLHSFVVALTGIPDDCYSVVVRLFRPTTSGYYDLPVELGGNGCGRCYIIGTCFATSGSTSYEVHAYDGNGNMTALGSGLVEIAAFSTTASPLEPGQSVPIMQITDSDGAYHTIKAVSDGMGGYTTIIDDSED